MLIDMKQKTLNHKFQRKERVSKVVHQVIAESLIRGDILQPGLKSSAITIIHVRMSTDLSYATITIDVFGEQADRQTQLELMQSNVATFKQILAHKQNMRFTPELKFILASSR